ncbi:MAG: putative type transport system, ATP-binding and permease component [Cyanobacteria bacterium RYN_339]|nr:putative type transport system, ATP-binding and permease component [Cyanobacteria bacterium RYN_339]
MIAPHRVWAVASRHLYIFKHSPVRILEMIYWPLLDLVLWGFVSISLAHTSMGSGVLAYFLGALILWDLLFRAQQGVALAYLEEVWARNLLNLFVSPLTASEFVAGTLLISLLKLVPSVIMMAVLAFLFYGYNLLGMGFALIPFAVALLLFGWSLGIVTTALVLRLGQGAESLAWVVAFAFQPISCVFYPLAVLPPWLQPIALATPPVHIFEGMRGVLAGHPLDLGHLGAAYGLDLLYVGGAIAFFYHTFAHVKQAGLLAKTGE